MLNLLIKIIYFLLLGLEGIHTWKKDQISPGNEFILHSKFLWM